MTDVTPTARAAAWLSRLGDALAAPNIGAAVALFDSECYWRDLLTFTWNIKTMEGHGAIARMLEAMLAATAPSAWTIVEDATETDGVVEAWFTFETRVARGKGHLRLRGDKGWTFLTTMTELQGHEERRGATRENGVAHGAFRDRRTWLERKRAHEVALGRTVQPYCVIIGGGQGGIALGARLKRLGVPAIILEKNARPGDSWRYRYDSLVLHDPVWYDHLPYLPFPDHWPVFTPKDQMGNWLEAYAKVMELDYWASSPASARVGTRRGGSGRSQSTAQRAGMYSVPNSSSSPLALTGRRASRSWTEPRHSRANSTTRAAMSAARNIAANAPLSSARRARDTTSAPISGSTGPRSR